MPKDYFDNLLQARDEFRHAVGESMSKAGELRKIVKERIPIENEVGAELDEVISLINEVHFSTIHKISDKINALLP